MDGSTSRQLTVSPLLATNACPNMNALMRPLRCRDGAVVTAGAVTLQLANEHKHGGATFVAVSPGAMLPVSTCMGCTQ